LENSFSWGWFLDFLGLIFDCVPNFDGKRGDWLLMGFSGGLGIYDYR
jgi:hypothetical protein